MWAVHILNKESQKQVRSLFPTHLLQFRVEGGWNLSLQLRVPGGNPPWTGRPSFAGEITTPTHSDWDNQTCQLTSWHLSGVWEEMSVPGENPRGDVPTLHRQWSQAEVDFFLLVNMITNGRYLRTCYIINRTRFYNANDVCFIFKVNICLWVYKNMLVSWSWKTSHGYYLKYLQPIYKSNVIIKVWETHRPDFTFFVYLKLLKGCHLFLV